jgi:hypothetical protein
LLVMMNPFGSTMTPDPSPRSLRSFGASNRFIHSSPKNRLKNGSSNGVPFPSSLDPFRVAKMFTTAGFTTLATSTKLCPPRTGQRGLHRRRDRSGRADAVGGTVSGTACPVGNHPRSEVRMMPMSTPAIKQHRGKDPGPPRRAAVRLRDESHPWSIRSDRFPLRASRPHTGP